VIIVTHLILFFNTYLKNPVYEVKIHFEFNEHRPDLKGDWNEDKHFQIFKRSIKAGGRRYVFLGTRECQAYVESVEYDQTKGYYDDKGLISFGTMVHGFFYPDESGKDELGVRLWQPKMENGIIKFPKPESCSLTRTLKSMKPKNFALDEIELAETLLNELGLEGDE